MRRVLITDDVHELLISGLEQNGYICDYFPNITNEAVLDCIADYTGIIINSKILINKKFLDQATQLRFVGRLGSGLEIIDLEYAAAKGVAICSSPDGNCDAVAEQAMAMLLTLATNLLRADAQVRQKIWQREANRGWELMGKTIGIIGCGHTGSALARRLVGWGMQVLAYDKYKKHYTNHHLSHVTECESMDRLYQECDIVSLHLPLTTETKQLANADFFGAFSKNIVLLNTSRGQVVNSQDLLAALQNGKIKAAALDVFENEKPATYTQQEETLYQSLFALPNVVFSPHIAGWTKESKERLAQIVLNKIVKLSYY